MIYLRMQKNSYKEDEDKNYNLFKETVTEVPLLRGRGWRSRGKIRQWYRDNNIWHQDINNALVACGLNDEWNHVNHWELYSNLLYYLICVDSKVDLIAMVAFTPSVRGRRANYNITFISSGEGHICWQVNFLEKTLSPPPFIWVPC